MSTCNSCDTPADRRAARIKSTKILLNVLKGERRLYRESGDSDSVMVTDEVIANLQKRLESLEAGDDF